MSSHKIRPVIEAVNFLASVHIFEWVNLDSKNNKLTGFRKAWLVTWT